MALIDSDLRPSSVRSADVIQPSGRPLGLQETFLQGVVTAFDNFSRLLQRGADSQLVYKHAISTVMPTAPIQLYQQEEPTEEENASEPAPRRPVVETRRR
jgi:Hfq protein